MIQNLKFRDVWYFISQKGIKGFTLMEQVGYYRIYLDGTGMIQWSIVSEKRNFSIVNLSPCDQVY